MSDSPQPGSTPHPYSDPAYAGGGAYGSGYSTASVPSGPEPTTPLPAYWTQTQDFAHTQQPGPPEPPREPPRGPRPWLWALGGFALATVLALVVWLVMSNSKLNNQETSIPAMPQTSITTSRTPTTTAHPTVPSIPSLPSIPGIPIPSLPIPGGPSTGGSGETEPVEYQVTGTGTAMSIMYVDAGGMMQFEYNVSLPWDKKVDLPKPAKNSASITVINSGRNVTCSISISGVQVVQNTSGLFTTCGPQR
ncbi:MAG TPA: MmpS family transport accessory protein [Mycobacterium sp.]|nr:MmpS family transport accessory protein [Mycobacterium sp.]